MNLNTVSTSGIVGNVRLVFIHRCGDINILEVIDVAALTNFIFGDGSAEITPSLLMSLVVGRDDKIVVVHNWMPESKFHGADQFEDSVQLLFGDPVSLPREEGPVAHASANSMTVEHPSWELISWRPGVAEGVRSALMSLPKISVLIFHIRLHGHANDSVTKNLELFIVIAINCAELGVDEPAAGLLNQLEEWEVFHGCHLDDLGDTVTDPPHVESFPEVPIGDGEDWRVIGTIE